MKNLRSKRGPFSERPHFSLSEIDEMCAAELLSLGLYPTTPQPVRIDRFIEKRWQSPLYEDLPEGVLGFTKFGPRGVEAIVVSNALDDTEKGKPNERRFRTTLAHEAGTALCTRICSVRGESLPSYFKIMMRRLKFCVGMSLGKQKRGQLAMTGDGGSSRPIVP
jgi:hypothetical protein